MIELFMNLALGAATAISPAIPLLASQTYLLPQTKEEVVVVSFSRHWTASDSECTYHGYIAPYVRTWPIVEIDVTGQERKTPPDLVTVAGYGVVINQRLCGDASEDVFFAGNQMPLWHGKLPKGIRIDASNVELAPVAQRPEWLSQVVDRINEKKGTNLVIPPLPASEEALK